ncbi:hypothetical protein B0H12DRAFT_1147288 [Mycena haematopus]|nr:hypothetical protein B0H12DRAFT_1147288 [Mycena haematopus]
MFIRFGLGRSASVALQFFFRVYEVSRMLVRFGLRSMTVITGLRPDFRKIRFRLGSNFLLALLFWNFFWPGVSSSHLYRGICEVRKTCSGGRTYILLLLLVSLFSR